jgi:hypothetical protein
LFTHSPSLGAIKSQSQLRFIAYIHIDRRRQKRKWKRTTRKQTLHRSKWRTVGPLFVFPQLSVRYQRIRFSCNVTQTVLCTSSYRKHIYKNLYPYIITVHAGTNLLTGTKQSKIQDVTFPIAL